MLNVGEETAVGGVLSKVLNGCSESRNVTGGGSLTGIVEDGPSTPI